MYHDPLSDGFLVYTSDHYLLQADLTTNLFSTYTSSKTYWHDVTNDIYGYINTGEGIVRNLQEDIIRINDNPTWNSFGGLLRKEMMWIVELYKDISNPFGDTSDSTL